MASLRVRRISAILFVATALAFLIVLLRDQWGTLEAALSSTRSFGWTFRPLLLLAAVSLGTANLFFMALVWTGLFHRLGGEARRPEAARVWVLTNFGRYIPGKVWQLGGLAAYMRGRGDSGAAALVSALAFQIVVLVTGTAVAVGTLGVGWVGAGSWVPGLGILVVLLFAGLHPAVIRWAAVRLGRWLGEGSVTLDLEARDVARAAAGMMIAWLVYGAGLMFLLRGVGIPWDTLDLPLLTGVFAASYVAGYLVLVAPGGLVVREGAMTALLAKVGALALGVAAAASIMARLWVVATELTALAIVLAWPGEPEGNDA
jgi:uncharacterized membrane protein YbhN (UPF0104 family)